MRSNRFTKRTKERVLNFMDGIVVVTRCAGIMARSAGPHTVRSLPFIFIKGTHQRTQRHE